MIGRKAEREKEFEELSEKYDKLYSDYQELKFSLREMKASADEIEKQSEEIRQLHESMRSLKHDMKNHLMVTLSYLNDGDEEAARAYISQIINKLNAIHSYIETGNSLLNHILNE
ncbi:MAG: Spo0B domain-containing protein, partial [Eubacterium sp.]|nr:Spo0B domain-containing protein [Eubacterium sp.]